MHRLSTPRRLLLAGVFYCIASSFLVQNNAFKSQQLTYERVRTAYQEKEASIKKLLAQKQVQSSSIELFLRAFKRERVVEVWVKEKNQKKFILLKQYDFCETSGDLGPKRQMGDGQIPEGCYFIDRFNPASSFHLSLGINYPNASDQALGVKGRLGADIFIHGNCVTIGCIPITDDKIKELYLLAVEAKSKGQAKIPVYIFPTKLNEQGMKSLIREYRGHQKVLDFWKELQPIYAAFEDTHQLPNYRISSSGKYELTQAIVPQ